MDVRAVGTVLGAALRTAQNINVLAVICTRETGRSDDNLAITVHEARRSCSSLTGG